MHNKKFILVFVLATAVLAGALVFDGVSHRISNQPKAQNVVATTTATTTLSPAMPKPDAGIPIAEAGDAASDSGSAQTDAELQAQDTAAENQNAGGANADAVPVHRVIAKHIGAVVAAPLDNSPQPARVAAPAPEPPAPVVLAAAVTPDIPTPAPVTSKRTIIIPAGTLFSVRLGEVLASDTSEAGQSFAATLDHDVTINGKTAITAGAAVTGKVAFARPLGPITGEPTLQLRLVSVNVGSSDVPVVTAIRTFGPPLKGKNKVSRFMKGLLKRYEHQEQEVVLDDQSAYSFTLRQPLKVH